MRITGDDITLPVILFLALVILRLLVRHGALSWDGLVAHEGALLFPVFLIVYLANGRTIGSGDTLPARYLPLSILREGNFDLDEFPFLYEPTFPYFLTFVNGHFLSDRPVGAVLLAIPFYLLSALGHINAQSPLVQNLEKLSAASIVALSAVVLYCVLRRLTRRSDSLLITAVYALGTSSLSSSSQALWQHGASQLAVATTLYCLVRGRTEAHWRAFAGFPLAFAVISRPTDVLLALPLGLYVLFHHRPQVVGFLLSGVPPVCFQLWYNAVYFGNPFRVQFFSTLSTAVRDLPAGLGAWSTTFWQGIAGLLFSPGRGLFVYSPVFLLSALGIGLAWRNRTDLLLRYAGVGTLLTILVYGRWSNWWGGGSYGPRLLADLSPVLALFLYPVCARFRTHRLLKVVSIILIAWSVGAHAVGAFVDDGSWNSATDMEEFPERLWLLTDNQLLNPPRELFTRAVIAMLHLPTSRTAPALVSASYRTDLSPTIAMKACEAIPVSVEATNTGSAVWLGQGERGQGLVSLGWRWRKTEKSPARGEGQLPLRFSVLPGQSYQFRASIPPTPEPGTYVLELAMVNEGVPAPSARGTPPVRVTVKVEPAPILPERLQVAVDDAPRLTLATDQLRYRAGDSLQLLFTGVFSDRPWRVDVYLLLRGPDGAWRFWDGRQLIGGGDCGGTPLGRAVRLGHGGTSGPLVKLPVAGMPPGAYTWHLLLVEVEQQRVIAAAQATFEVAPRDR